MTYFRRRSARFYGLHWGTREEGRGSPVSMLHFRGGRTGGQRDCPASAVVLNAKVLDFGVPYPEPCHYTENQSFSKPV